MSRPVVPRHLFQQDVTRSSCASLYWLKAFCNALLVSDTSGTEHGNNNESEMTELADIDSAWVLTKLFELHEQNMYRIAYAILHDEGQAEDAVMAAFERIVKRNEVPSDPASSHASRLMATIVRSTAIDIYRKNARERKRMTLMHNAELPDAASAHDDLADRLANANTEAIIRSLPEPYREVLHAEFIDDCSTNEIAERLGLSEANVRKRKQRGLDLLRKKNGGHSDELLFC